MRTVGWLVFALFLPAQAVAASGPPAAAARTFSYGLDRYTPADGLPSWQVRDLLQTPDGYLWIATPAGLARFDGEGVHVISRGSAPEMPSNLVQSIALSRSGHLLLGGSGFLLTLDGAGRVQPVAELRGLVHAAAQDATGRTWVYSDEGRLGSLDPDGRYREAPEKSAEGWCVDRDGELWLRKTDGSIERVEGDTRSPASVRQIVPSEPFWVLHRQLPSSRSTGRPLDLRLAGDRVVAREDDGGLVASYPAAADAVPWIVDSRGQLWVGRTGAVEAYGGESGAPVFRQELGEEALVSEILEDHEGNLWIGTRARGLFRLRPRFVERTRAPGATVLRGFTHDADGSLLVESASGLWHVARGKLRPYLTPDGRRAQRRHADLKGNVWHVVEDRLVGTTPGGASVDLQVNPASHFANVPGDAGGFWMASSDGLFHLKLSDAAGLAVERRFPDTIPRASMMHVDGGGRLWVADGERVHRIEGGRITTLDPPEGLNRIDVRAFLEDPDGTLWMGTAASGLVRLREGRALRIGARSGLAEDGIFALLEDGRGRFWMSGHRGIHAADRSEIDAVLDGRSARVRGASFATDSGAANPEEYAGLGASDPDGILWFSSFDSVQRVDAELARELNASPPIVHIEGAEDGESLLAMDPEAGVVLRPGRRRIDVEFTGISLRDPKSVTFEARLEPLDHDWVSIGGERRVHYANLGPGRYRLRIRGWSAAGVPSLEDAVLPIEVLPRFTETLAFKAILGAALLLGAWGAYSARLRGHRRREIELDREVRRRTEDLERTNRIIEEQARRLSELDAAKSRFFANVSHEFRTPLTLILGPLEDVVAGMHGEVAEEVIAQLQLASDNAHRLLRMVNQLLDTARLEAGRLKLQAREADAAEILGRMGEIFRPMARHKGLEFTENLPQGPVPAWIDEEQLEKVLVNLLGNAFKFTPAGGRVEMTASVESDALVIRVRDTGPGIPEADLPHVFDRFYQGEGRGASTQPGTGIGLSLARDLVRLHHGSIEASSPPGAGAMFEVRLPLGDRHLSPEEKAPPDPGPMEARLRRAAMEERSRRVVLDEAAAAGPAGGSGMEDDRTTVLVVEDNTEMRAYLRRHLEVRYRVTEASDGSQALEAIGARVPDLIVSDVMMAGMDGLELCRRVKEDPDLDFVPVILLTAKASGESRIAGLETGADDYLSKPVDTRELLARADNLIESRRKLRRRLAGGSGALPALAAPGKSPASDLVESVLGIIDRRLGDESFGVDELARELGQSRRTLYRRLEEEGTSPSDLILRRRLDRASALLAAGEGNVSEVAYAVGFRSVSHFSRRFREHHGISPSRVRSR